MSNTRIHVAYTIGRRGGTSYRAVAVAKRDGDKFAHTHRVCIDDTRAKACGGAVHYVMDQYRRDGLEPPIDIVDHGRQHSAVVDSALFARDEA